MGSDWVEISQGVFSTELGGLEKIYCTASQASKHLGHEHWGLYDICSLSFGPSVPRSDSDLALAVRNAWISLRHEFPGLALISEGLTHKTYTLPNARLSILGQMRPSSLRTRQPTPTRSQIVLLPGILFGAPTSLALAGRRRWNMHSTGPSVYSPRRGQ